MSRFLRRIASTIAPALGGAEPRLHPMIGSIFAPAPLTHLAAAHVAASVPAPSESAGVRAQMHERAGAAADPHMPLFQSSLALEPAVMPFGWQSRPAYPRDRDALVPPQDDIAPAQAPASLDRQHETIAPHGRVARDDSATRDSSAARGDAGTPALTSASQHVQQVLASALVRPSRIAPVRPASEGAQRTAREPDEIHIHIGRVEVAAVAAPAPRAASSPTRKSLSLDDYLRRGNGRRG